MKNYWLGNWAIAFVLALAFMFGTAGEANAQRIVIRPQINNYNYQYNDHYGNRYGYYNSYYPAPVYSYGAVPLYQAYPAYPLYQPYQYYGNYYRPNYYSPWYRYR